MTLEYLINSDLPFAPSKGRKEKKVRRKSVEIMRCCKRLVNKLFIQATTLPSMRKLMYSTVSHSFYRQYTRNMSEEEKIHSSIDNFLWPNKLILLYTGLWPISPDCNLILRYFNNFRIVFSIVFTVTIVVPQVLEIIDKWGDLEIMTGMLYITFRFGMKFLIFIKNFTYNLLNVRMIIRYDDSVA